MDAPKFSRIAESLRQYRRAELKDFEAEIASNPLEVLYVDPLPGDAILQTMLSSSTTFILGRKGTGKSTVFAKAQSEIRKRGDLISVYTDVKALYETINASEVPISDISDSDISDQIFKSHMLRKSFLGAVLAELVEEVRQASESMSLWDRWRGRKWDYDQLQEKLSAIAADVKRATLTDEEIPILRRISETTRHRRSREETTSDTLGIGVKVAATPGIGVEAQAQDIDKTLADNEIYTEYSDVILRSFPFISLLEKIKTLLDEAGIKRLIVFFDDFSELDWIDQRLFVDVVLAPLNNTSDERVKLKVAGYPGRVYYGKIDPGKIDTIHLDFSKLYESHDIQSAEMAAVDYTKRLLVKRFEAFVKILMSILIPGSRWKNTCSSYLRLLLMCRV